MASNSGSLDPKPLGSSEAIPESRSGRIPPAPSGRIRSATSGSIPRSGVIRGPSDGSQVCGPGVSRRGATHSAPPRRSKVVVVAFGMFAFLSVCTAGYVAWPRDASTAADVPGLPPTYAMACAACKQRFEMPAVEYRRVLAARKDKSVNRIECPKCGAGASAYRQDSGMDGLGEIGPDGQPTTNPRRPGGQDATFP